MKERPILFSGAMVRAILDGRKSQTRRMLKPQPKRFLGTWRWKPKKVEFHWDERMLLTHGPSIASACPYGQEGDRLWVREMFAETDDALYFAADGSEFEGPDGEHVEPKWKPSIHMPRWASRITLEIVRVRAERLQDISEADAIAEGIRCNGKLFHSPIPPSRTKEAEAGGPMCGDARTAFKGLWDSINGPGSWEFNPWVWVVEFRREDKSDAVERVPTKVNRV